MVEDGYSKMKKLSKIYEEVSSECDGCQYFDMNSIYDNVEFDKPLYALVSKRRMGKLVYLTPKQYIYKIAMGFGGLSYEDALLAYNSEVGEKYAQAMKGGDKFPVGHYTVDSSGQEGRHRCMAAMKLGVNTIPVIEFKDVGRDEFIEYVKQFRGKSFDELTKIFIKNGAKGITMLGYNDLKRFIDYNGDELGPEETSSPTEGEIDREKTLQSIYQKLGNLDNINDKK